MKHPIPSAALDDRLAFVGTSGSGKTYGASSAVERLLATGARVLIIDPLGAWWGLGLDANGKKSSSLREKGKLVIFGGDHGDMELLPNSGALVGEAIAGMAESCIVDLERFGSDAEQRRFILALLTSLFKYKSRDVLLHVVLDEADMWAPQIILDKDGGDAPKLLGMMQKLVKRGRKPGFIPWLITQNPAGIAKSVLGQVDGMTAFSLTSSQDRDAIGNWVKGQANEAQWKEIWSTMPTLETGKALVWLPRRKVFSVEAFPKKNTFDSSRAPKRGERITEKKLKPINLDKLQKQLASVEAEIKANDPKALKAEIATLRAAAAKAPAKEKIVEKAVADPKAEQLAFAQGWEAAYPVAYKAGAKFAWAYAEQQLNNCSISLIDSAIKVSVPKPTGFKPSKKSGLQTPPSVNTPIKQAARAAPVATPSSAGRGDGTLPPGEKAVLVAAAQFGRVERDQLSVLTGYKRSSRDAYIARLQQKQYITVEGREIVPTQAGVDALGADYEPLPQGPELRAYWLARLPEGEKKVLEVLIAAFPNAVSRESIDEATGYKRSSRDAYLARMKQKRIVVSNGSLIAASETLF